jgi:shikimate kinase
MMTHPDAIYLTGFMASGKSTVGRLLAGRIGHTFVDLDHEVEIAAGMSIPEIFRLGGESRFRQLEAELLRHLASRSRIVVSTGGGALAIPENMAIAKNHGLVIYLDAPEDLLVGRILRSTRRPLIEHVRSGGEAAVRTFVQDLLAKRRPIYEQAHFTIHAGHSLPESITYEILEALRQLSLNDRR